MVKHEKMVGHNVEHEKGKGEKDDMEMKYVASHYKTPP